MARRRTGRRTQLTFGSASRYRMPVNAETSIIAREQRVHGKMGGWTGRGGPFPMLPQNGPPHNPQP